MEEVTYPCRSKGCDHVFYLKADLKKHEKVHTKDKNCCLHCNKTISRAQNLKLHQHTCGQNENRIKYRRFYGVDPDTVNGGFKLVESAFKKMFVTYRKMLDLNALQLEDMKLIFSQDVKNILQSEVVKRFGIKWNLGLKAIMYKPIDPSITTNPPAVFNTDMMVGLIGSNYEDDLNSAYENVMQQIDDYQNNGSGWMLDQFVELDVNIVTYAPFMGRDVNDDDDDYDGEQ